MAVQQDFRNVTLNSLTLRRVRTTLGWKLADMAAVLGISASTLSRLENDRLKPDADRDAAILTRIVEHLDQFGGEVADYLRPHERTDVEMRREFRRNFFSNDDSTLPATLERLRDVLNMSFSIMDENGSLLLGRPGESAREREHRRIMRLRLCQSFRASIHAPRSRFRLVADDGDRPVHPCNRHDAELIRCALALGHVAFSRCPAGILSAIVPFRAMAIMRWTERAITLKQREALALVDFCFGVPTAQTSYVPPPESEARDECVALFHEVGWRDELIELVPERITQGRHASSRTDALELQRRSLNNFHALTSKTTQSDAEVPWAFLWSEEHEPGWRAAWVDYQLQCLIMKDPLFTAEISQSETNQHRAAWAFIAGDAAVARAHEDTFAFNPTWLAEQHQVSPREVFLQALTDFPAQPKGMRMHLDGLSANIRSIRALVSEWFRSDYPRWLMDAARSVPLLNELKPLIGA